MVAGDARGEWWRDASPAPEASASGTTRVWAPPCLRAERRGWVGENSARKSPLFFGPFLFDNISYVKRVIMFKCIF
jgi:hypothetical protein